MIIKRGYAPEEQYRGNGDVSAASDVYSVAATIYFMLSGTPPKDAMERTDSEKLVPPCELADGVDHNLNQAVMNALILDPHQRTQSARAFRDEIMSRRRVRKRRQRERENALYDLRAHQDRALRLHDRRLPACHRPCADADERRKAERLEPERAGSRADLCARRAQPL